MSWLHHSSWIWIVCVTITLICAIILMMVLCIHVYNSITISYFENRKTINNIAAVFTFISAICGTGVVTLQFMLWFEIFIEYCYPLQLTLALLWNPAKLFMQLVFVLNLHFVYKQTLYRYNPRVLSAIGISLIVIYGLLLLWTVVTVQMSPVRLSNGVGMRCNARSPIEVGLVVMCIDVVCSIGLLIAFIRPIKRMVREHGRDSSTHKVLYTQTKVTVLVGTASVSTLILLLSLRIIPPFGVPTLSAMMYVLVPTDQVINVVSLILLAQYYDNNKCFSYEKVCCCMIACCRCACGINHDPTEPEKCSKTEIPTRSNQIPTEVVNAYTRTEAVDVDPTIIGSSRLEMTTTDADPETTSLMET